MSKDSSTSPQISEVGADTISSQRKNLGRGLVITASILLVSLTLAQIFFSAGIISFGFENWRPVLYAYLVWSAALCASQVIINGESGKRALFVLPAVLFTIAMVVFPTIFGVLIAFTNWNLSAFDPPKLNGLDNLRQLWSDHTFWNALRNMVFYVLSILGQYVLAFSLALLLNADIKARKFFRISFLLPFMLSPVAVSWMIGKSLMAPQYGPMVQLMQNFGWADPVFFPASWVAVLFIILMDAWVWIPFIMILLLAGLQALSKEIQEAAKVDGASEWQSFWQITFPLMLPVSITAIVLRIIFQLKLADLVINTTSGGPGGTTDTISSFIFREYRERSNVGYGTMIAEVYLIIIVIFVTLLLKFVSRWMQHENNQ